MSENGKLCDRCGSRLGRGTVHIVVTPADDSGSNEIPALEACRECAGSLSRWLDRGRDQSRTRDRPRKAEVQKHHSKRSKVHLRRNIIAFVVMSVVLAIVGTAAFFLRSFGF